MTPADNVLTTWFTLIFLQFLRNGDLDIPGDRNRGGRADSSWNGAKEVGHWGLLGRSTGWAGTRLAPGVRLIKLITILSTICPLFPIISLRKFLSLCLVSNPHNNPMRLGELKGFAQSNTISQRQRPNLSLLVLRLLRLECGLPVSRGLWLSEGILASLLDFDASF